MRPEMSITSVAIDALGRWLAASEPDGTAPVWSIDEETEVARIHHGGYLASLSFAQDGELLETANGHHTEQQGVQQENPESKVRVWHWRSADLVDDACRLLKDSWVKGAPSKSLPTCP